MTGGSTKSGVLKYDVRRLQRIRGIKYTSALRELEAIDPKDVKAYIDEAQKLHQKKEGA